MPFTIPEIYVGQVVSGDAVLTHGRVDVQTPVNPELFAQTPIARGEPFPSPAPQIPVPPTAPSPNKNFCEACSMPSVRWDPRCAVCNAQQAPKGAGVFASPVYVLVRQTVPSGMLGGECEVDARWYDVRSCEELNYLAWSRWKYGAPHDENACIGTDIWVTTHTPPAGWDRNAPRVSASRLIYTLPEPMWHTMRKRIEVELPPIVTPKDWQHVPPVPDWNNPNPSCDSTPNWHSESQDNTPSPFEFQLLNPDLETDDVGWDEQ